MIPSQCRSFQRTVSSCNFYAGQQVDLLVSKKNENGYKREHLVPKKKNGDSQSIITSVVPGDFDGDVQMDVLLTRKPIGAPRPVSVEIYWGNSTAVSVSRKSFYTAISPAYYYIMLLHCYIQ